MIAFIGLLPEGSNVVPFWFSSRGILVYNPQKVLHRSLWVVHRVCVGLRAVRIWIFTG